jgi:hypothetical protein
MWGRRHNAQEQMRKSGARWTDALISMALAHVWDYVMALNVFAYPTISTADNLHERHY